MGKTILGDVARTHPRMSKDRILQFERFSDEICRSAKRVFGKGKLNPAMLYITPTIDGVHGFPDLALGYTGEGLLQYSSIGKMSFKEISENYPIVPAALSIIPCKHQNYRVLQANEPLDFNIHFGSVHLPSYAILVEDYHYSCYDPDYYSGWYYSLIGRLIAEKNEVDVKAFGGYLSFIHDKLKSELGKELQPFVCRPMNRRREWCWGVGLINMKHVGLTITYK